MAKKKKQSKKRSDRRERAKLRSEGVLPGEVEGTEDVSSGSEELIDVSSEPPIPSEKKTPKVEKPEPSDNIFTRLVTFLNEVKIEAKKINWPSSPETTRSAKVVVVTIVFLALFMGAVSVVFKKVTEVAFNIPTVDRAAANVDPGDITGATAGLDAPEVPSGDSGPQIPPPPEGE